MMVLLLLLAVLLLMIRSAAAAGSRVHMFSSGSSLCECIIRSHFQRLQPGPPPGCSCCALLALLRLSLSSPWARISVPVRGFPFRRRARSVEHALDREGSPSAGSNSGCRCRGIHQWIREARGFMGFPCKRLWLCAFRGCPWTAGAQPCFAWSGSTYSSRCGPKTSSHSQAEAVRLREVRSFFGGCPRGAASRRC